ncbi:putative ABC transport system ATP-binding protein [Polymorphobacter multimanifer]|uniref:Putative ABC transport system ATP-binding protein n=2 Tax=Polymorphobacter multimanifer TaxID=1070431 RepID=A0A841L1Y6_9SPHN|nr:ABC transporter ATP-binding protein [Polymorphobacter multimanifer]MBB6226604.1 putative ABC transport system ATP-binding protein [Polymorphobacter multimanifer]
MATSSPPAARTPVLAVHGLAKSVGGARQLFAGLELSVAPGETVAIMGESGAGKSTLLNLLAGLDVADAGEVRVAGLALTGLDEAKRTALRRDRIGFVFQAFHVLPHLTLGQNVALPLLLKGAAPKEGLARAATLLAAVGLEGRAGDYPAVLSGGEMQRVAIARALVHAPMLLLADEPTGNLDPQIADKVLALLLGQARAQGAALVMVTHSARAAAQTDRVLQLAADGLHPVVLHHASD